MNGKNLRYGYTTGSCAAAAVKGAAQMLRDQVMVDEVELRLPCGETARFRLHGGVLHENTASCYVIKDAGDDPDVTNGAEIHATAKVEFFTRQHTITIEGGVGIGRVTKPGLAVPVGEWAINPVPRKMIMEVIKEVFAVRCVPASFTFTVSIPNGVELAKKTLNERLGIVGGLSILGTTGIVKPISTKAWTDTVDASIDVALACGSRTVVLATGRTSEMAVQQHLAKAKLSEEAFVMMGDHFGYSIRSCAKKGVPRVIIAGQFAKLVKIACGHEQTHVSSSVLDLATVADWLKQYPDTAQLEQLARVANTARHLLEASDYHQGLIELICSKATEACALCAPGLKVRIFLAGYHGDMLFFTPSPAKSASGRTARGELQITTDCKSH
jgi:cobalt-precorrin-5B (C1)-methyltransferase